MEKVGKDDYKKYAGRRVVWCFCKANGRVFYVKGAFAEFRKDVELSIRLNNPVLGYPISKVGKIFLNEDGSYVAVLDSIPYKRSPHENAKIAALADKYRVKYDNPDMIWVSGSRKRVKNGGKNLPSDARVGVGAHKGMKLEIRDLGTFSNERVIFALCRPDHSLIHIAYTSDLKSTIRQHLQSKHDGNPPSKHGREFLNTPGSYLTVMVSEPIDKENKADQYERLKEKARQLRDEWNQSGDADREVAVFQEMNLGEIVKVIGNKNFQQAYMIDRVRRTLGKDECWDHLERLRDKVRHMMRWLVDKYPRNSILRRQLKDIEKMEMMIPKSKT